MKMACGGFSTAEEAHGGGGGGRSRCQEAQDQEEV